MGVSIKCKGYVLQWQFNGFSVPADVIVNKNKLTIEHLLMNHTGTYRCLSLINGPDAKWASSILHVGGKNVL